MNSQYSSKLGLEFEKYIKENPLKAKSFHPFFEKSLNEMVLAGGKRFRPVLLLTIVNSFFQDKVLDSFDIGYAIELIHTYSLIHDDLPTLDNADLRRGYPTLHKTYDEVTAILVGDGLNTCAFNLISKSNFSSKIKINLVETLSEIAGIRGMVLGQAIDCYYDFNNKKLDIDEIKFMHKNKTGKMIAGSLKMGAIICELEKDMQDKIYEFGLDLGLLFQIQDDIFDVTKSEEETLKTTNLDENKNSFVNLIGLDESRNECEKLVVKLEKGLDDFDLILKNNLKEILDKYIYRHRE